MSSPHENLLEEEGISYLYCNKDQEKPIFIGTKRFAGLFSRITEQSLGTNDEKPIRIARAMRKAEKTDKNMIDVCVESKTSVDTDKKSILPCCSFDWYIPPHYLERLINEKKHEVTQKKEKKKNNDDDDDEDGDIDDVEDCDDTRKNASAEQQKKNHKETVNLQKNSIQWPRFARNGHIEDQYGHEISLEDFLNFVVAPCRVRLYDRIPKHFV